MNYFYFIYISIIFLLIYFNFHSCKNRNISPEIFLRISLYELYAKYLFAKKSATWCGIINVSIAYQSRKWQVLWSARGATISPLIWSTKNESGASRMHRLYFTWEKFLAGNFSFARAVCRFFFLSRVGETRVDVLGEKRVEIGTTRHI